MPYYILEEGEPAGMLVWTGTQWVEVPADAQGRPITRIYSTDPSTTQILPYTYNPDMAAYFPQRSDPDRRLYVQDTPHAIWSESNVTQQNFNDQTAGSLSVAHTVPAATTFYMTSLSVQLWSGTLTGGQAEGLVYARDSGNVLQWMWRYSMIDNQVNMISVPFTPPLEIPTGWNIAIFTNDANLRLDVTVTGYEVT